MKQMCWTAAIVLMWSTAVAFAITNGTIDGAHHANVGTIVYLDQGTYQQVCTGTLISERVFLTAGHCAAFLQLQNVQQVFVTFDPVFTQSSARYAGTVYLNPLYPGRGSSDPEDIAVIVLNAPVSNVIPAMLPPLGLLDRLATDHSLSSSLFTIVGYGTTDTEFGGGKPDASEGRGTRRYATEGLVALNPDLVRLDQNVAFGFGGSSHGDSGGPNFLGAGSTETNILVAITWGGDPWGISQTVAYRLDTPEARTFLGQFVTLP